ALEGRRDHRAPRHAALVQRGHEPVPLLRREGSVATIMRRHQVALALALTFAGGISKAGAEGPQDAPAGKTHAAIDLATEDGVRLVQGQWRYRDARIVETEFPGPGSDNQPTGPIGRTYDLDPKAGAADFDDSKWEAIAPTTLSARRGHGRLG